MLYAIYNRLRIIDILLLQSIYKSSNGMKLTDYLRLQHFLLFFDNVNGSLPLTLNYTFQTIKDSHNYTTRSFSQLKIPFVNTIIYGMRSIKSHAKIRIILSIQQYMVCKALNLMRRLELFCQYNNIGYAKH